MQSNAQSQTAPESIVADGTDPLPLSVCIVAYNEAATIGAAIASAAGWAAEVVVVNCESTDDTAAVARAAGAVVYDEPNRIPEENKNRCADRATSEWVFILDADELLTVELRAEIAALLARSPRENGFKMPRRNFYFGTPLRHGGAWPDRQLRLFRRGRGRFPGVGYHERLAIEGDIGELASAFDHHPYPTFDAWLRKLDFYSAYGASVLAERNVPITAGTIRRYMVTRPMRRWLERLFLKRGIRDGAPGVFAAGADFITNIASFLRHWTARKR